MKKILSILIPSLNARNGMLEKLKNELHRQVGDRNVEVVHVSDDGQWIEGLLYEYKCKTTFEEAHRFQVKNESSIF